MKVTDYDYNFPPESLAVYPPKKRGTSKLFVIRATSRDIEITTYDQMFQYVGKDDLVIRNVTQVINSRLKVSIEGMVKEVEIFVLSIHEAIINGNTIRVPVLIKGNKKKLVGQIISLPDGWSVIIEETAKDTFFGDFISPESNNGDLSPIFIDFLSKNGEIPLPPYLNRKPEKSDEKRYRTIFGREFGSAAAPTASLNFTVDLESKLKKKGTELAEVVLHVGLGTFSPLRNEIVEENKLHSEFIDVSEKTIQQLKMRRVKEGKIVAIGTTALRTLESITEQELNRGQAVRRETDIFIYPPYQFRNADALMTNFHLPKSSLIILVDAFLRSKNAVLSWREIYDFALKNDAKIFSYGDSMLILPN